MLPPAVFSEPIWTIQEMKAAISAIKKLVKVGMKLG